MAALQSGLTFRFLIFLSTAWTLTSWLFLIDTNFFSHRQEFQESDFIMTFYVAGAIAANGRLNELYPDPNARSFIDSPFDKAAHSLLPDLPKTTTAAYMYIPIVAGFFAPFSYLNPNLALFFWQALSVLALAASATMMHWVSGIKTSNLFFLSFLYAPVFLTLWAGQLGLTFGLLPLCLGYLLLRRQWPFVAGVIWALLLLKPQYFLPAVFVTLVCAGAGQFRPLLGIIFGTFVLLLVTVFTFSLPVTVNWLLSHRVSDAYFFAGLQGVPNHLITGLPANIMVLFTAESRGALKLPLYGAAALMWISGLWLCMRLTERHSNESLQTSIALIVGVVLASITLPHLLYYDLGVLWPAGVLLLAKNDSLGTPDRTRLTAIMGWVTVSGFLPFLLAFPTRKLLPLFLELVLTGLFARLLWQLNLAIRSRC